MYKRINNKLKKIIITNYINDNIPPYKSSKQITWSPDFKRWVSETVAANPEAKHKAITKL